MLEAASIGLARESLSRRQLLAHRAQPLDSHFVQPGHRCSECLHFLGVPATVVTQVTNPRQQFFFRGIDAFR